PGGMGGTDIWVTQRARREDPWGEPVNLGPTVNTADDEGVPSFSRDGHFMYFNSVRPGGFGGNDIWISWRAHAGDDFGWEEPVNLGATVNGPAVDQQAFISSDREELFFASNRPGGLGSFDLYMTTREKNPK